MVRRAPTRQLPPAGTVTNLRPVHTGRVTSLPPYDIELEVPSNHVVIDAVIVRYVLAHLIADVTPTFPVAHREALNHLAGAIGRPT